MWDNPKMLGSKNLINTDKKTGSNNKPTCSVHGDDFIDGYGKHNKWWCEECRKVEDEEEKERAIIFKAHSLLNLPERLKNCSFDTYKTTTTKSKEALKACRWFVENYKESSGLIMLGSVGTGKTHLAVAICKTLCDKGLSVKMTTVSRIIRQIKETWNGARVTENMWGQVKHENERDIMEKFSGFDLLVVDEIGSQYGSDTERIAISEIINDRYNAMRPTIIIGNVTLSEAEKYLGGRVIDRLKDNGCMLAFDWESYRKPRSL